MKDTFFNGKSRFGNFTFRKMLTWLESSSRYRYNDPLKLIKASGIKPGQQVLEVGCGSGFFTPVLSNITGKEGFIESIDLHPVAVDATTEKLSKIGANNIRVSRADAHKTGFADASFDYIIIYGVVPAPVISEPRLGMEMHRLLKPGGTLAVWTLAPFWGPKSLLSSCSLNYCGRNQGVHIMRKNAA